MKIPGFTAQAALTENMTTTGTQILRDPSPRCESSAVVPQWFGSCTHVGNVMCCSDGDAGVCGAVNGILGRPTPSSNN
jgi:hypothetical protein